MGYWNYRLVRTVLPNGDYLIGVHEVYYREDGSIEAIAESPTDVMLLGHLKSPFNKTKKELKEDIEMMLTAFDDDMIDNNEVTNNTSLN